MTILNRHRMFHIYNTLHLLFVPFSSVSETCIQDSLTCQIPYLRIIYTYEVWKKKKKKVSHTFPKQGKKNSTSHRYCTYWNLSWVLFLHLWNKHVLDAFIYWKKKKKHFPDEEPVIYHFGQIAASHSSIFICLRSYIYTTLSLHFFHDIFMYPCISWFRYMKFIANSI